MDTRWHSVAQGATRKPPPLPLARPLPGTAREEAGDGEQAPAAGDPALLHSLHARLLLLGLRLGGRCRRGSLLHAEALEQLRLDLRQDLRVLAQEALRLLAPLPDALTAVAKPGAALLDDVLVRGEVEHVTFAADA